MKNSECFHIRLAEIRINFLLHLNFNNRFWSALKTKIVPLNKISGDFFKKIPQCIANTINLHLTTMFLLATFNDDT